MTDMLTPTSYMLRYIIERQQRTLWQDIGWLPDDNLPTLDEWYDGDWRPFRAWFTNRDYWLNPMLPPEPDTLDAALDAAVAEFEKASGYVPRRMLRVSGPLAYRIRRGYRLRVQLPAPVLPEDTVPRRNHVRRYRVWQTAIAGYIPIAALIRPNPFA